MNPELKIKNIVLIGIFDPAIFDKYFFIKNKIVAEEEILNGSIFGQMGGMQLICNNFSIIIGPNQIIISSMFIERNSDLINLNAKTLIEAGNMKNISAMGMNFHWFLDCKPSSLESMSRKLFFNDKIDLFNKYFNTDDALFGAYASINFKDARLKLDIKPSKVHDINGILIQDALTFAFNFHFDVKNNGDNALLLHWLGEYSSYQNESERIISDYKYGN